MENAKGTKATIRAIRDSELRKHMGNFFRAVEAKIKYLDANTRFMDRLEKALLKEAKNVCGRYQFMMSDSSFVGKIAPEEHQTIRLMIEHMIAQALLNIHGDHDAFEKMNIIASEYYQRVEAFDTKSAMLLIQHYQACIGAK